MLTTRNAISMIRRACLLLGAVIAACQSSGGVLERLDVESGLTVVTDSEPVVFSRTQSQFSRSARDYIYLGPVEVNERGTREFFLWVGVASTIDRGFLASEATTPEMLYLNLEGEPMEFELRPWDERVSQLSRQTIYEPVVAPATVLAAPVTLDQLALISEQQPRTIRIAVPGQPTVEYVLWSEPVNWQTFADR